MKREYFGDPKMEHLSCLLRRISSSCLNMRLKSFGMRYSEMVAHRNELSLRHQLTKTIIFHNQWKDILHTVFICKCCTLNA